MEYQSGAVSPVASIQEGWRIIKDDYAIFFGMSVVAVIILFVLAIVLGLVNTAITAVVSAAFGVAASNASDAAKMSAAILPQLISMIISIFTNIILQAIAGVLFCGIYMALARKASTGVADFGDLFAGFQKFTACLIAAVFLSLAQFAVSLVTLAIGAALGFTAMGTGMLTKDGQLNPAVFSGLFAVIIVVLIATVLLNLIISALTVFVYPLIADRNLSGGQALILSIRAGLSNIFGIILLMILAGLMIIGGFFACVIGILFVAPIVTAAFFAAYQSVFGRAGGSSYQNPPPPPIFNNQPQY